MSWASENVDSVLDALDEAIARSDIYEQAKKERIYSIKKELAVPGLTLQQRYGIHVRLYKEYEYYISDSAHAYVDSNMAIALQMGRRELLDVAKIKKARLLSTSGLFAEAIDLISTVDKSRLSRADLAEYYMTIENTYIYHSEYAQDNHYTPRYVHLSDVYRDSVMMTIEPGSFWHLMSLTQQCIKRKEYAKAEAALLARAPHVVPDSREYAVLTGTLAYVYELWGKRQQRMYRLAQSAIADIHGVVKENMSLRLLAEMLYADGDVARANNYLKKSLADATMFNARMRNMQSSKMLPMIDATYQTMQQSSRRTLTVSLVVISILSVFLIVAIAFIIRYMKRLRRAHDKMVSVNDELSRLNGELVEVNGRYRQANLSLSEANVIKEEYIGRFLQLCSTYISEMESYRKMLNRKAATGRIDDVLSAIKSSQFISNSLKEFYKNFDTSFLNIYPDFVEQFNRLLPEEERIYPKQGERLSTELRTFALIRLGITDSSKIANFLRCSITTIYTYRSKIKNKSLYRDDFESQIMKISSFAS